MIDINKIKFVCNWCENEEVDCSVVEKENGEIIVYVRTCQQCGGKVFHNEDFCTCENGTMSRVMAGKCVVCDKPPR